MKQIVLLCIVALFLLHIASADIVMPGTKSIDYCTQITNADDFSDYYIIGIILGPMGQSVTIIHNNDCFNLGYKFNNGKYYIIKKENYELLKEINHTIKEENPEKIEYYAAGWETYHSFIEQLEADNIIEPLPIEIHRVLRTGITDPKKSITDTHTLTYTQETFSATSKRTTTYNNKYFFAIIISIISLLIILHEIKSRRGKHV